MSFYQSKSGMVINGSAKLANTESFKLIVEGTMAIAMITKFCYVEQEARKYYEATYKIIDGDYKNYIVRQKIKCFDEDPKAVDRALNQLLRIFNLCDYHPTTNIQPTDLELAHCVNTIIGILIGEWHFNGKEGNFVRGTFANDANFVPCIPQPQSKQEHKTQQANSQSNHGSYPDFDSALTRNSSVKSGAKLDGTPFDDLATMTAPW